MRVVCDRFHVTMLSFHLHYTEQHIYNIQKTIQFIKNIYI